MNGHSKVTKARKVTEHCPVTLTDQRQATPPAAHFREIEIMFVIVTVKQFFTMRYEQPGCF